MENNSEKEKSLNEKRIKEITQIYYSRADVKKALFEFSKNRECVPRYFESFGKRPDNFQYEADILEEVNRGATSFHCSEELWEDPLEISTENSRKELDELRLGWDLILDIDSPYLEYSKTYAGLIIESLKFHGIENIGVKFSGSKGFHIIVPWKAFPKEIYGQKTKDMFPEWPRIICEYLSETLRNKLEDEILKEIDLKEIAKRTGKDEEELLINECNICKKAAVKKDLVNWICSYCKNELIMIRKNRKIPKCPTESCRKIMEEKFSKIIFACEYCNVNSYKNPEYFKGERYKSEEHIEADLILVAPRHLFRMPYSLHEKTSLSSVVIDKNKIKEFQIKDAKPFKEEVKDFYPDAKEMEAKNLLLEALDWNEQKEKEEEQNKKQYKSSYNLSESEKASGKSDYKEFKITNLNEDLMPPCIKLLLKGIKSDGRKRALFILINFFKSIGLDEKEIEKRIDEWNEKNYSSLKKGYIQSQLSWYKKNQKLMPPNCNKTHYKDLNICKPDELCRLIKNPVNYSVRKYFRTKR